MRIPACPFCRADLRQTGVREYGFVSFEAAIVWDYESETFKMRDEPRYGLLCSSLDWECGSCGHDLPEHPDELC